MPCMSWHPQVSDASYSLLQLHRPQQSSYVVFLSLPLLNPTIYSDPHTQFYHTNI